MVKMLYAVTVDVDESKVRQIAEKEEIELQIQRFSITDSEDMIKTFVKKWEDQGVEIILCRGTSETLLRSYANYAHVMGMEFTFDTVLVNLCSYRRKNPEFFNGKEKAILMISKKKIPVNHEVVLELFHARITEVSSEDFENMDAVIGFAEKFDLVIAGIPYAPLLEKRGIPCCFESFVEEQSLKDSFRLAKMFVDSRRQLQEKNREIQNLLDNSFNAYISVDRDCRIVFGNRQIKHYFKCDVRNVRGKSIFDFLPGLKKELLEKTMDFGEEIYGELIEFEEKVLVMNLYPLYADKQIVGAGLTFEELHQIEKIEQKARMELYSKGLVAKYHFLDILGQSEKMETAKNYARRFASHDSNILLYGESGTGKELFAQSIHNYSARKNGPFVAVNCGALPSSLLESELFGYAGGAFTGASKSGKKGLIEMAHKGTIFLDEISEMEPMGQVRLLRVLEERVISRVGDDKVIPVDVRIISASNKNLGKLTEEGRFREDLYYRLNVLMLKIPPLREREGDILLLADHFIHQFAQSSKKQVELDASAKEAMRNFPWKGNVRQLRNFCERLVIISNSRIVGGDFIRRQLEDSFFEVQLEESSGSLSVIKEETPHVDKVFSDNRSEQEKQRILEALNISHGRRMEAAERLGISKTSLWRKMKKYGITEQY